MTKDIQKRFEILGENACYMLCLFYCAGVLDSEVLFYYDVFMKKNLIEQDCYINDPVAILKYLGVPISFVEKTSILKEGKIMIAQYKYMNYLHFVVIDKFGNVVFDPLGESNTVKFGKVNSYRIFK